MSIAKPTSQKAYLQYQLIYKNILSAILNLQTLRLEENLLLAQIANN
jgi:hypothetical protein